MLYHKIKQIVLDFLFPLRCCICRQDLFHFKSLLLCGDCWLSLSFITSPLCDKCGSLLKSEAAIRGQHINNSIGGAFDSYLNKDTGINYNTYTESKGKDSEHECYNRKESAPYLCWRCSAYGQNYYYGKIRAALLYNKPAQILITRFKYEKDLALKSLLTNWLSLSYKELLRNNRLHNEDDDVELHRNLILIPIPLHKKRLRSRGYNQAAILAKVLSEKYGLNLILDAVIRVKNNRSQSELRGFERKRNVKNIFKIKKKYKKMLYNQRVILIDDVVTTGATINECAKILRKEGFVFSVDVIAIART